MPRSRPHPCLIAIAFTALVLPALSTAAPEHLLFLQDVAWSPDGRRFAFSRYDAAGPYEDKNWTVWIADRDGGNPHIALRGALVASFSPDGERLAAGMLFDGDWEIATARTDGTDVRRLTRRVGRDALPAWSPDGRTIVYAAEAEGGFDLYQIAVGGGEARRLTHDPAGDYNPVFSPDGRRVVFYRETGDQHDQVWTLDLATGREERITDGSGHNIFPVFLPDGRIAYSGQPDGGERRLVVVSADGARREPLGPAKIFYARWSPDGREVLFLIQDGKGQIHRMTADGSGVAVRLDTTSRASRP